MNLQEEFNKFHAENPHVYDQYRSTGLRIIQKAVKNGVRFVSSDMIGHVMRFEMWGRPDGEKYKVNNNYLAYFCRLFKKEFPEYSEYFRTRKTETEKAEIECPSYLNQN